jgi:bifunctional DNA-binding transcriptional regulator/antitoxin component of YhaV-PrlF toxin-antitoxin module
METKKNNTSLKHYTITLQEDPETGELVLPFTEEILIELGWKEGDVLEWIDNKDGSWSLVKKKIKKNKKVVAKSKTI